MSHLFCGGCVEEIKAGNQCTCFPLLTRLGSEHMSGAWLEETRGSHLAHNTYRFTSGVVRQVDDLVLYVSLTMV